MREPLDTPAMNQLFFEARTYSKFADREVSETVLREIVEATSMGPTSANCQPVRIVFVKSEAAKEKLRPHLSEGNVAKTMAAPVCAIIAQDLEFYELLPRLYPPANARSWFVGKPKHIADTAFRNSSLQGAYFILAARALGLDCGPMSGFDNAGVDAAFFAGTPVKSNFLCNLGYGDAASLRPRSPRLQFEEMARIA